MTTLGDAQADEAVALAETLVTRAWTLPHVGARLAMLTLADALRWAAGLMLAEAAVRDSRLEGLIGELQHARRAAAAALGVSDDMAVERVATTLRSLRAAARTLRGGEPRSLDRAASRLTRVADPPADELAGLPPAGGGPLSLGASAPATAAPGARFTVHVLACAPGRETALLARLGAIEGAGGRARRLGVNVATVFGAATVRLILGPGLSAPDDQDPARAIAWTGADLVEDFEVVVDAQPPADQTTISFRLESAGLVLSQWSLRLTIASTSTSATAVARAEPVPSVFASYSSADRDRVLDRVAALRITAGIDVFVDCLDLAPGKAWQQRLEREIERRERFILFWSAAAAASRWVRWEYTRAIELDRRARIQIQPLQNDAPPPRALRDLHFADPLNDAREAHLRRLRRSATAASI